NFYPDEEKLGVSDPGAIECAIRYLQMDPFYHRSGYNKERLLRALKKIRLSDAHKSQLVHIMLNVVDSSYRREFRFYCRLAAVLESDFLVAELLNRASSQNEGVRRRAGWMLEACR
ncbi:MAG: hypothetical protein KDD64_15885, partial [Bdellovibrionales bacterium]|nr:hypothetical protein [Bdellovibrionales bacterium]